MRKLYASRNPVKNAWLLVITGVNPLDTAYQAVKKSSHLTNK